MDTAIYPYRQHVEIGGLIAYSSSTGDLWRQVARDIDQILRGLEPDKIPIYQQTKFELVVKTMSASARCLTIAFKTP
jgi:putative ABC transport system substrate-binding protein